MNFALIVCTYKRPGPLIKLLDSVLNQTKYPDIIIVIDGSPDNRTSCILEAKKYPSLLYQKIERAGLTRQRNLGISLAYRQKGIEVICFLDDDIVLTTHYFEELIATYSAYPNAVGVGGYILEDVKWEVVQAPVKPDEYIYDGWVRKLGSRNLLRRRMGLLSNKPPGFMPEFAHSLSISFLPPTGNVYPVQFFMGGVSSFRTEIFKSIGFSEYFEGYGLYEDLEFCIKASELGQLYVNTAAKLYHFHDEAGRPNKFQYGKMVMINGWYVWRRKFPNPSLKAKLKWHSIAFLLTLVRLSNIFTTGKKKEAFTEAVGRIYGWGSLFVKKPVLKNEFRH